MNNRLGCKATLIVGALCLCPITIAAATSTDPPAVGALVRVIAPALAPDWRLGIFNRLRVEPPCYRVVILQTNSVGAGDILSLDVIARLQVHRRYDGALRSAPNPDAMEKWNEADWVDVPIKPLQAQNQRQCPANN